ncbi:MAG: ester cyclase [Chloroflexota bacterium]|nr:ester cyclase [Chloroflexota bacterium]
MARQIDTLGIACDAIDALNHGDEDRLKAHLADDAVWISAATGETYTGPTAIASNMLGFRNAFPDLNEAITNSFAADDQAAIETMVTGTYDGKAMTTIPGSGDHIKLPICYLVQIQNGKIAKMTTYMDYRTLMTQLDMLVSEQQV